MQGSNHIVTCAFLAPAAALTVSTTPVFVTLFSLTALAGAKLPDKVEIFKSFLGHRTWSHCLAPQLALFAVLYHFYSSSELFFLTGFLAGSTIHILMDMFSKRGSYLLPYIRIAFRFYSTGKPSEVVFTSLVCVGALFFMLSFWQNGSLLDYSDQLINSFAN